MCFADAAAEGKLGKTAGQNAIKFYSTIEGEWGSKCIEIEATVLPNSINAQLDGIDFVGIDPISCGQLASLTEESYVCLSYLNRKYEWHYLDQEEIDSHD